MEHARLLKFKLIAPTNFNWKRLSVKCPKFNEWMQYVWDKELDNDVSVQVEHILTKKLGFSLDEVVCFSEDNIYTYVLLTNHAKHIMKERNH